MSLSEAYLLMKMQQNVIAHLEQGHGTNETIAIIQVRGAFWRQKASELLKKIEQDEAYLFAEREHRQPTDQEVLQKALEVIEKNLETIAEYIEDEA